MGKQEVGASRQVQVSRSLMAAGRVSEFITEGSSQETSPAEN